MLHRPFQRLVVLGAAILFLAYAIATDDPDTRRTTDQDENASDDTDNDATTTNTVVDAGNQAGQFGTWSMALRQAKLVLELEGDGPFTLFAPTDDAFGKLKDKLDELLADERRLAGVLRRHIVPGNYATSNLSNGMELKTLAETTLKVTIAARRITVGAGSVVEADLTASNGVIHGIDTVLFPVTDETPDEEETP
jgi:uncharacterized surface protein with fasciclin (FAS1) repeats